MATSKPKKASYKEVAKGYYMVPKRGPIDRTSAPRDARLAASGAAAKKKQAAAASKPVPLGGVKKKPMPTQSNKGGAVRGQARAAAVKKSVPAKNTGGAMKNAPSPVQRELKRKPVPKKKPLMRKSMPSVPAKNTGGAMAKAGKSKVGTAKSKGFAYGRKTV